MIRNSFYLILAVILLSGCGPKKPEGIPKLYPVTITITQKGQPLADASVCLFAQDDSLKKWCPSGNTDTEGNAKIFSYAKYPGVGMGKYKVSVSKYENIYNETNQDPSFANLGKQIEASFLLVEPLYSEENTTTLEIEVVSGNNNFTLDVGSPVRKKIKAI